MLSPVFAVVILALSKPTREEADRAAMRGDVKRCPHCAELVRLAREAE